MTDTCKERNFSHKKALIIKLILVFINIALLLTAILFSLLYSKNLQAEQTQARLDSFCATVDSMKQISDNYLKTELGYVRDWAKYMEYNHMDIHEALDYINHTNTQKDRYVHIVDMQTFSAYSSYDTDASDIQCYQTFRSTKEDATYQIFLENMQQMFSSDDNFNILGKYRADDTQQNVISVGTKVTLTTDTNESKDYLMLRLIPIESIRQIWIFPLEYTSAEVGIITKSGNYVVPSKSMRSRTFADFIRGYNFENDYNKVDELVAQLTDTDTGILEYKNCKGENCYWYYSGFEDSSQLDILGCIPVDELNIQHTNWTVVFITCGILLLLMLLDGAFILHINKQLRETAKMAENASQAKTQFLSTMSHDIRTPMNAVIGMTTLAKTHLDDPAYVKNCLDKSSLASEHLLTLINDILDISKIENGNMTLNPSAFSMELMLERLLDIVQVQIADKHLTLSVDKDLPKPYLIADEVRLNQIFINILTNAIKYTPAGGSIALSLKENILSADNVRLTYQVSDTGIGMSEEFQANMYHLFARELDSRVDKTQGTGLGLAIVKQMVDLMHGMITCKSHPNEGTTFTISIDLACATQEEYGYLYQTDTSEYDANLSKLRILIAEDNDLNYEIIEELLKGFHITCDRATNGSECIDLLMDSPDNFYDLILMDVQMPVKSGIDATKEIRLTKRPYAKNIPIIAMTADAFAEDVQACLDAGMNGHLAKPVDMKKVLQVLRKINKEKENI